MCKESELREMEFYQMKNGNKVKHFLGENKQELEKKLWKYVFRNHVDIRLLVCRRKRYSIYY